MPAGDFTPMLTHTSVEPPRRRHSDLHEVASPHHVGRNKRERLGALAVLADRDDDLTRDTAAFAAAFDARTAPGYAKHIGEAPPRPADRPRVKEHQ